MSLLDELGREADAARSRREAEAAQRAAHEADSKARLEPAMQRIEHYFRELAAHLRDLDRPRSVSFHLADAGQLQGLQQSGYRAGWTEQSGRRRFLFSFRCQGKRPVEAKLESEPHLAAVERKLRAAGLRASRSQRSGADPVLLVAPDVPVSLAFETETDDGDVLFTARNLFVIGEHTHRFDPERVQTELLDAIGRMVLGERADFDRLMGNQVDEGQRQLLARRLARERRRREAELGGPLRRALFPLAEWFRRTFLRG